MSKIARHMETVIRLLEGGAIVYLTGLIALGHAVGALESTLQSIVRHGYESINSLLELEEEYGVLNIEIHTGSMPGQPLPGDTASALFHTVSQHTAPVNLQHLNRLEQHAENLRDVHTLLAQARNEGETALDELHAAQARLRRLEPLLSTLSVSLNAASGAMDTDAGRPPSSLVARILQEAAQRTGHLHQSKSALPAQPLLAQETALWDEMEIDPFTEANVLAHSFTEAIADVATATSQLRLAFEHLNSIVTQQVDQANIVRSNAHLLRSIPFSVLATQLQESVELIAGDQIGRVQLELSGETIEIDQDILQTLAHPLLELVQSTVADGLFFAKSQGQGEERKLRAWLNAHAIGNEVTIEISFSLPILPVVITEVQATVHCLNGSLSLRERSRDRMAF